MIDGSFTIPEFVELLVASALAGLLAGCLLIYIYYRFRRHCCLRPADAKAHHTSGDASMIDPRQQSPTIPIQTPPPDEYAMPPEPKMYIVPRMEYPSISHQRNDYQGQMDISKYHDRGMRNTRNTTSVDLLNRTPTTTTTPPHNVRTSGSPRYLAF